MPHLLKGIHNNLLTKTLEIDVGNLKETKLASWHIIGKVYYLVTYVNKINKVMRKLSQRM